MLATEGRLGWADSRTLGMRSPAARRPSLLDTSLEPVGDFVSPLLAAFDDPDVGVAGGWGVTSGDAREFSEAPPGEVDAIEGYCLAVRREALRAVRGFDRRFRWYRNADLDFSFAVRDAGWRAIRTDAAATRAPRAPRLDAPARDRARSAEQAELLPLPATAGATGATSFSTPTRNDDARIACVTWPWLRRPGRARAAPTGWRSRSGARSSPGAR